MPRLTNSDYHATRAWLAELWQNNKGWFSYLSAAEQYALHDYFVPSKHLSDEALLEHRQTITKQRPSLPHQAGKAASKLDRIVTKGPQVIDTTRAVTRTALKAKSGKARNLTVRAVMRPEPDFHKLARALIALKTAELKQRKEDETST